jgi:hypothetical protein
MSPSDADLLKRFEPVLRFTRGEKFYPIDVASYVKECSLWVQYPEQPAQRLIPEKDLTLEKLGQYHVTGFRSVYFLQFIEPLNATEMAAYLVKKTLEKKDPQDVFRSGRGRLSRVGYTSRFLDGLFSISLLTRGRVPGDRALAAALTYDRMRQANPCFRYHGRVVRQSGWIVLQYWYFYVYNNWRSGYYGANDHEADWEMVNIYLYEDADGSLHPEWAGYASHDFSGDDLRRRWDDPELEKVGDHPVVYVASGSHASYFSPGDYLTEIEIPFFSPVVRFLENAGKLWRRFLRRTIGSDIEFQSPPSMSVFSVPFVDYARGDGFAIGEGAQVAWDEPLVVDPVPDWVENYRGLWGYYARDPFAGENAPSGMRYNREGTVRRVWYDPVGWAGLDKVLPPRDQLTFVVQRKQELNDECQDIRLQIAQIHNQLANIGIEMNAMRGLPYLRTNYSQHQAEAHRLTDEIRDLREKLTSNETMINVLTDYEAGLAQGKREPARGHLKHPNLPEKESELRMGWLAEIWSALSIGLMLIALIALAIFARQYLYIGLAGILILIILVEAAFRRRLSNLVNTLAIALALVCFIVLVYQYFWVMLMAAVTIASLYMIWQNLREVWS